MNKYLQKTDEFLLSQISNKSLKLAAIMCFCWTLLGVEFALGKPPTPESARIGTSILELKQSIEKAKEHK